MNTNTVKFSVHLLRCFLGEQKIHGSRTFHVVVDVDVDESEEYRDGECPPSGEASGG
jgi:hypothetical protein